MICYLSQVDGFGGDNGDVEVGADAVELGVIPLRLDVEDQGVVADLFGQIVIAHADLESGYGNFLFNNEVVRDLLTLDR